MMLIFKVMVCFLAVFTSEDCVGGLPTIQDSPDNRQPSQSARSASNQGVTNEPGSRPREILDDAVRREEDFHLKVNPDMKLRRINSGRILSSKITGGAREKGADQLLKFQPDVVNESENIRGDGLQKGSSAADRFVDKSESRNDEATSAKLTADSRGEERDAQRFSSVYARVSLEEKVNKNKEEFKNNLSTYLAEVLDTVAKSKASETNQRPAAEHGIGNPEAERKAEAPNAANNPVQDAAGNLLAVKKHVPMPEEEARTTATGKVEFSAENRRRKSVGDVVTWHQQSTNMRPTRTQHLVQNKRSTVEGNLVKLPVHDRRRSSVKVPKSRETRAQNRRQFTADDSAPSTVEKRHQLPGVNPIQINAAMAYNNRQPSSRPLNIDLSRALYQFGPAQLHALRGVFDKVPPSTQNFKPIAPKQVAYVPPRIIYDTKIVPTPFMQFKTEQKTVEALSALLGQNPAQQLQGFNLILRKDVPDKSEGKILATSSSLQTGISRQGIHDGVALTQAFVTPIPSIDNINSELADGSFRFSQGVESGAEIGRPFDHRKPQYNLPAVISQQENPYKTIPIVEVQDETQRGQQFVEKEVHPAFGGGEILQETTDGENEGRYSQHRYNEQGEDHGDAYAAKYSFGYHVKDYDSGNSFGHQETRDGVITRGRYHVLLPDGRLQDVKYHVDEGGYHAKVSYQSNHSA